MDEEDYNDVDKTWVCKICKKVYSCYKSYWTHVKKKKTACISKEQCSEIVEENELNKNRIHYFETKTQEQKKVLQRKESEIKKLKDIVTKLSEKDIYIKESIDTFQDSLDQVKETMQETIQEKYNSSISHTNNFIDIENYNDNKMLFAINLSENAKEKLDHISNDQMMAIMNNLDFNGTLKNLTRAVFFHPKAPENWKWCVTDKNAKFGALEYNAESNTVIRKMTGTVISTNMQNVVFQVTDILEELKKVREFNEAQSYSYSRFLGVLGNEFTPEQINCIKETAFDGRNFPKALWENLDITVETTPVICHVKTKRLKTQTSQPLQSTQVIQAIENIQPKQIVHDPHIAQTAQKTQKPRQ